MKDALRIKGKLKQMWKSEYIEIGRKIKGNIKNTFWTIFCRKIKRNC